MNVSAKQFAHPGFVQEVTRVLAETGIEARHLRLEITESAFMENSAATMGVLLQLRQLGVKLDLDDFGTGYSSLSYLHRMPVDALKIDRSFVDSICTDSASLSIARTIAALARAIGVRVVAEGVETEAQLELLRGLGCDDVQGYLFSKPVDSATAGELLGRPFVPLGRRLAIGRPLAA